MSSLFSNYEATQWNTRWYCEVSNFTYMSLGVFLHKRNISFERSPRERLARDFSLVSVNVSQRVDQDIFAENLSYVYRPNCSHFIVFSPQHL